MAAFVLLLPFHAFAAQPEYVVDQFSADLYVETDASVHAIERRVVTFDGEAEGLALLVRAPNEEESVEVASVRVVSLDDSGNATGEWTVLEHADIDPASSDAGSVDAETSLSLDESSVPWYLYDPLDGMLHCSFPVEAGSYMVELDYLVSGCVTVYRDVGELSWRYVQSEWPADTADVTLRIALPVPAGAEVAPNSTVRAWGHGPAEGTFEIGEDGSVAYRVSLVPAGHYAEAHVLFPAYWAVNLSADSPQRRSEARRAAAIADEDGWCDQSARASIWDNKVRVMLVPIAIVAVLAALAAALAFGESGLTRRWFVRIAAALGIVALVEQAFFREPLVTGFLAFIAGAIALLALGLPKESVGEGPAAACSSEESGE